MCRVSNLEILLLCMMLSKVIMIDLKSIWMASAVPTHLLHPFFTFHIRYEGPVGRSTLVISFTRDCWRVGLG